MDTRFPLRRMIAILTLIAFSVQEIALSAPTPFQVQEGPNREAIPPSVQIPPETGEIRAVPASNSKSNLYIIHIQDAHGNYEAQQNIEKILGHLRDQYGIGLIFKEGADEKLDPSFFRFFEDRALDLETADLLMRHGAFSGVEKFLLEESINPGAETPEVYGMEDGRIYSEDLALFRSVTQKRKETLEWLSRAKACVDTLESRLFSGPLLRFVREWKKFKRTESGIGNFAAVAGNAASDSLSIDLKDPKHQESFGSVLRLLKLQEIEAGLDFEKILAEKESFLRFLAGNADPPLIEAVSRLTDPSSKEKNALLPRFVFERIMTQAAPKGLDFRNYPEFTRYAELRILESEILPEHLFKELDELSEMILNALAQKQEERKLIALIRDLALLEKLCTLELTRPEYGRILTQEAELAPAQWLERAVSLSPIPLDFPSGKVLEGTFRDSLDFYRLAEAREKFFIQTALEKTRAGRETLAVMVSGGFHSAGIEAALNENGIPHWSVIPRISSVGNSSGLYLNAMLGETKILGESQIDNVPLLLSPEKQKKLLGDATLYEKRAEMIREAVEEVAKAAALGKSEGKEIEKEKPAIPVAVRPDKSLERGISPRARLADFARSFLYPLIPKRVLFLIVGAFFALASAGLSGCGGAGIGEFPEAESGTKQTLSAPAEDFAGRNSRPQKAVAGMQRQARSSKASKAPAVAIRDSVISAKAVNPPAAAPVLPLLKFKSWVEDAANPDQIADVEEAGAENNYLGQPSLKLTYSRSGGYLGYSFFLPPEGLNNSGAWIFDIKGDGAAGFTEKMILEFKTFGDRKAIFEIEGIGPDWKRVEIPVASIKKKGVEPRDIREATLVINQTATGDGVLYLNGIANASVIEREIDRIRPAAGTESPAGRPTYLGMQGIGVWTPNFTGPASIDGLAFHEDFEELHEGRRTLRIDYDRDALRWPGAVYCRTLSDMGGIYRDSNNVPSDLSGQENIEFYAKADIPENESMTVLLRIKDLSEHATEVLVSGISSDWNRFVIPMSMIEEKVNPRIIIELSLVFKEEFTKTPKATLHVDGIYDFLLFDTEPAPPPVTAEGLKHFFTGLKNILTNWIAGLIGILLAGVAWYLRARKKAAEARESVAKSAEPPSAASLGTQTAEAPAGSSGAPQHKLPLTGYLYLGLVALITLVSTALFALTIDWKESLQGFALFQTFIMGYLMWGMSDIIVTTVSYFGFVFFKKGGPKLAKQPMPEGIPDGHRTMFAYMLLSKDADTSRETFENMYASYMNNLDPNGNLSMVLVSASKNLSVVKAEMDLRDEYRERIAIALANEAALARQFIEEGRTAKLDGVLKNNPRIRMWIRLISRWQAEGLSEDDLDRAVEERIGSIRDSFFYLHRNETHLKKPGQYMDLMVMTTRGIDKPYYYIDEKYAPRWRRDPTVEFFGFRPDLNIANDLGPDADLDAEIALLAERGSQDIETLKAAGQSRGTENDRSFRYTLAFDMDNRAPPGVGRGLVEYAAANPDIGIFQPGLKILNRWKSSWHVLRESLTQVTSFKQVQGIFWAFDWAGFWGKALLNNDLFIEHIINEEALPADALSHDTLENIRLRSVFVPDIYLSEMPAMNQITRFLQNFRWKRGDVLIWETISSAMKFLLGTMRSLYQKKTGKDVARPWIRAPKTARALAPVYLAGFSPRIMTSNVLFLTWIILRTFFTGTDSPIVMIYPQIQMFMLLGILVLFVIIPKLVSAAEELYDAHRARRAGEGSGKVRSHLENAAKKSVITFLDVLTSPFVYQPDILLNFLLSVLSIRANVTGQSQWKVQSDAEKESSGLTLKAAFRAFWFGPAAAVAFILIAYFTHAAFGFLFVFVLVTWFTMPIVTWLTSKPVDFTRNKGFVHWLVKDSLEEFDATVVSNAAHGAMTGSLATTSHGSSTYAILNPDGKWLSSEDAVTEFVFRPRGGAKFHEIDHITGLPEDFRAEPGKTAAVSLSWTARYERNEIGFTEVLPDFLMLNGEFIPFRLGKTGRDYYHGGIYEMSFDFPETLLKMDGTDTLTFIAPYFGNTLLERNYRIRPDGTPMEINPPVIVPMTAFPGESISDSPYSGTTSSPEEAASAAASLGKSMTEPAAPRQWTKRGWLEAVLKPVLGAAAAAGLAGCGELVVGVPNFDRDYPPSYFTWLFMSNIPPPTPDTLNDTAAGWRKKIYDEFAILIWDQYPAENSHLRFRDDELETFYNTLETLPDIYREGTKYIAAIPESAYPFDAAGFADPIAQIVVGMIVRDSEVTAAGVETRQFRGLSEFREENNPTGVSIKELISSAPSVLVHEIAHCKHYTLDWQTQTDIWQLYCGAMDEPGSNFPNEYAKTNCFEWLAESMESWWQNASISWLRLRFLAISSSYAGTTETQGIIPAKYLATLLLTLLPKFFGNSGQNTVRVHEGIATTASGEKKFADVPVTLDEEGRIIKLGDLSIVWSDGYVEKILAPEPVHVPPQETWEVSEFNWMDSAHVDMTPVTGVNSGMDPSLDPVAPVCEIAARTDTEVAVSYESGPAYYAGVSFKKRDGEIRRTTEMFLEFDYKAEPGTPLQINWGYGAPLKLPEANGDWQSFRSQIDIGRIGSFTVFHAGEGKGTFSIRNARIPRAAASLGTTVPQPEASVVSVQKVPSPKTGEIWGAAAAENLLPDIPLEVDAFLKAQKRDPWAVLRIALSHEEGGITEGILYLPGNPETLRWFFEKTGFSSDAEAEISPEIAAFNEDASFERLFEALEIRPASSQNNIPVILFEGVMNIKRSPADIAKGIAAAMNPDDLIIAVKNGNAKHPVIDQLMIAGRKRAVKVRSVFQKTATPRSVAAMTRAFSARPVSVSTFDDNAGLEIALNGTKVKINRKTLLPKGVDPVQLVALIRELADDPELTTERFLKAGFDLQTDGSWVVGDSFLELLQRIYAEAEASALVKQAA